MKVTITVEQFDNGISIKWESPDVDPQSEVALDFDKEKAIGKMIWDDVKNIMDTELCNVVTINIEYGKGDINQAVGTDSVSGLLG